MKPGVLEKSATRVSEGDHVVREGRRRKCTT
jgi:hypothetical protein